MNKLFYIIYCIWQIQVSYHHWTNNMVNFMKNLFKIVFSETDELMEHSLDDSLQSIRIVYVDEKSKMAITAGKCLINRILRESGKISYSQKLQVVIINKYFWVSLWSSGRFRLLVKIQIVYHICITFLIWRHKNHKREPL